MKKFLVILLCITMMFSFASCGSEETTNKSIEDITEELVTEEPEPEEPVYEYYEGTDIPTVDSCFDVELVSYDKYPIYGPFSNETNLKAAMVEYTRIIEDLCGYTSSSNSSDSAAIDVHTDNGTMIVYGTNLTGTGYVMAVALP